MQLFKNNFLVILWNEKNDKIPGCFQYHLFYVKNIKKQLLSKIFLRKFIVFSPKIQKKILKLVLNLDRHIILMVFERHAILVDTTRFKSNWKIFLSKFLLWEKKFQNVDFPIFYSKKPSNC